MAVKRYDGTQWVNYAGAGVQGVQGTVGIQGTQGSPSSATFQIWRKTAVGAETSLSGTDSFATTLAYTVGSEQVFINGVLLERGVDYVATTGTSITGLTALIANDVATVLSPNSFSVANALTLSSISAKGDHIVGTAAGTVGTLSIGSNNTALVADSTQTTGMKWATPTDTTKVPLSTVTAKGDLIAATASGAVSNLGVGTDGQVLTAASGQTTGLQWATPASGSMTLLASGSLSGTSTNLTSISQSYNQLFLYIDSWYDSGNSSGINMTFNSDTTASIYYYSRVEGSSVITTSAANIIQNGTTSSSANNGQAIGISLPNYSSTTGFKYGSTLSAYNQISSRFFNYNSKTAISSIQIIASSTGFSGGNYKLYGAK